MDPANYARAKQILLAVLECPFDERSSKLAELCGGDDALRAEVSSLLEQESGSEDDLDRAVRDAAGAELHGVLDQIEARRHPQRIGPYEVTGVLGEGGMGVVYRGLQRHPIEREVAIKFVRSGMATERVLARFHWERRSLARMDHPNIAKVYDAGADEQQRPYVVMELADGEPITDYCDRARLELRGRILLFLKVCKAVRHAHERGILHRDLKPSNIVVRERDAAAAPTIIDFGVAKALDSSGESDLTMDGQRIGTPAYMSPEQLRGDQSAVDTRTDVYALGIILFELLTGEHPFGREDSLGVEAERQRIDGATAPSETLRNSATSEAVAAARSAVPRQLQRNLRGDLDTICLEAIRPESDRRYPSVAALAEDLERFLDQRPILARPDSWSYRASKYARRNPAAVVAFIAFNVIALGGVAMLSLHADRLEQERDRALAAEERARDEALHASEVSGFLESMFTNADPTVGGSGDFTARDLLSQGVDRIGAELVDRPKTRGRLLRVIGTSYHALSELDSSVEALEASLAAFEELGDDVPHDERGATYSFLGTALHDLSLYAESEKASKSALAEYRAHAPGPSMEIARELSYLATSVQAQGRLGEAIPILDESIAMGLEVAGEDDPDVAWARNLLGYLQYQQGRFRNARDTLLETLDSQRRTLNAPTTDLAHTLNNLGGAHWNLDEDELALEAWREALGLYREVYGDEHPAVARGRINLGRLLVELGQLEEAGPMIEAAVETNTRILGPGHPNTASTRSALAMLFEAQGRQAEAERVFRDCARTWIEAVGDDHRRSRQARMDLAGFLVRVGKVDQAREIYRAEFEAFARRLGSAHPDVARIRLDRAEAALVQGEIGTARRELDAAKPVLEGTFEPDSEPRRRARQLRARCETGG